MTISNWQYGEVQKKFELEKLISLILMKLILPFYNSVLYQCKYFNYFTAAENTLPKHIVCFFGKI